MKITDERDKLEGNLLKPVEMLEKYLKKFGISNDKWFWEQGGNEHVQDALLTVIGAKTTQRIFIKVYGEDPRGQYTGKFAEKLRLQATKNSRQQYANKYLLYPHKEGEVFRYSLSKKDYGEVYKNDKASFEKALKEALEFIGAI